MATVMIVASRTPVSTTGQASGRRTRHVRPQRLSPMPRAASSTALGTDSRPVMVLRRIGKIAYSTSAVIVGARPSPNSGTSTPNNAREGIVSMVPVMPRATLLARGWPSRAIPSPTPMTAAMPTAIRTTWACSKTSWTIEDQRSARYSPKLIGASCSRWHDRVPSPLSPSLRGGGGAALRRPDSLTRGRSWQVAGSVVPGQPDRPAWYPPGQQVGQQRRQPERVDRLAGRRELADRPPPVSDHVSALEGFQPAGVHVVAVHPVEEEVVPEHAGAPAEIGVPGGLGDRVAERFGSDDQPGLLTQLARGGHSQRLAVVHPTARRDPARAEMRAGMVVEEPEEQQPPRPVDQQHPSRTTPVLLLGHPPTLARRSPDYARSPVPETGRQARHPDRQPPRPVPGERRRAVAAKVTGSAGE